MEAYTSFAQVYDLFMDNVPYDRWCAFIDEVLTRYEIPEKILLDLACGTGKMTRIMAGLGYDMIGVDRSSEMLDIARDLEYDRIDELYAEEECAGPVTEDTEEYLREMGMEEEYYDHAYEGEQTGTLYLCQDMRELELYGTIGGCYCSCNSLNYILEEDDLRKVFALVNNYLFPGGMFIFDINSEHKYRDVLADRTIAESRPESSFIWDNYYEEETGINEYDLTLFIREDQLSDEEPEEEYPADELPFYRFRESHYQKSYSLAAIRSLLEEAGMEYIGAYDNYTWKEADEESEIITILAREKGKRNR